MLRLLGFDTVYFNGENDALIVNIALAEKRIILTRDTHIPERKLITGGRVKAILVRSDMIYQQIRQVLNELNLYDRIRPFTLCLEDNQPLENINKEEVKDSLPPYVYQTQNEYRECPQCHRLYWKGTHWEAMRRRLDTLIYNNNKNEG